MRILAINQFYRPDHSATSQLLTELCEDLARGGDEVTVIASRGSYLGGPLLPAREVLAGVEVLRPWATSFGKESIGRRMSDYLTFWTTAIATTALSARPDVIVALTTPPMIAAGAALVSFVRQIPLVTWVQDVYPDIAVHFGVLAPSNPTVALLREVARRTHEAASRVVVLGSDMAARVQAQGADPDRIAIVPNWADGTLIHPIAAKDNPFRHEHQLDDRFVAMYSGNLGVGHEFKTILEAARLMERLTPDVVFIFVGQGNRRDEAERSARGLTNVRFLEYQPRERLAESLSAADVHLISLREDVAGLLVPSKLYGALASGRSIAFVGPADSEVARVIRDGDIGWCVSPGDVRGLVDALLEASSERRTNEARGVRARSLFERDFDRPRAVRRWQDVLQVARNAVRKA